MEKGMLEPSSIFSATVCGPGDSSPVNSGNFKAPFVTAVKASGAPKALPSTVRTIRPGAFGRACALSYAMIERSARMVDCVEPKRPLLFDSTIHFKLFSTFGAYAGSLIQAKAERA